MTASYRYLFCDLLSDRPIGDVEMSDVTFRRRLSSVGVFRGAINIPYQHRGSAQAQKARDICPHVTMTGGRNKVPPRALYVLRNDGSGYQPWWGGVVQTMQPRSSGAGGVNIQVQAATWEAFLHRGDVEHAIDAVSGVDQFEIARSIWQHRQAEPGGDIGVATDDTDTSGITRSLGRWILADKVNYGDQLDALANQLDGFEHTIDTYLDASGARAKRLRLGYPTITGSNRNVPLFTMTPNGGNLLSWSSEQDYTGGSVVYYARGTQTDVDLIANTAPPISSAAVDQDLLDANWPRYVQIDDYPDVSKTATLNSHAEASRDVGSGPRETFTASVRVEGTGWTPNMLGSDHRFIIDDAFNDHADFTRRVIGFTVAAPAGPAPETVAFEFSVPGA